MNGSEWPALELSNRLGPNSKIKINSTFFLCYSTDDILPCLDTSDTESLCKKSQTNLGATSSSVLNSGINNGKLSITVLHLKFFI